MRGVTDTKIDSLAAEVFQLTRLMRGVTGIDLITHVIFFISTHTPHARRDVAVRELPMMSISISTHTPHARRDLTSSGLFPHTQISTHTPHARRDPQSSEENSLRIISTHTPHARRDHSSLFGLSLAEISTHTPHARRDFDAGVACFLKFHFNSHASCEA